MMKTAQKGFTLIELAIVIVIVAVLAAVAVPRFSNVTRTAQGAVAKDLLAQVTSAASIFTAEQQSSPQGFNQFVCNVAAGANLPAGCTLNLQPVGNPAAAACAVAAGNIVCNGGQGNRFPELGNVTIAFNQGPGTFTLNCAAPDGIAPPAGQVWNATACQFTGGVGGAGG
jgi:prepilin-type N-terminal cleavage/methylation domain-containing protein